MAHINKKRSNTKLQIIRLAAKLFIEEGYSATTVGKIAKTLDLSPGNITFYFPGKEHLLSYCLELTSIAAACEEDEVTKDFFASAYSSPMILDMVRENDTEKTSGYSGNTDPIGVTRSGEPPKISFLVSSTPR